MRAKRLLSVIILVCVLLVQIVPVVYAQESTTTDSDYIQDETMLIIPIISMFGGNGMVVTGVLVGILIGIVGTLLVQHLNRTRKK